MSDTISRRKAFRLQPVLLVAKSNPKKRGSMSWDRFEGYFEIDWEVENTVQDLLDAGKVRMDDIMHDRAHGFIVVGEEAIESYREQLEIEKEQAIEAARKLLEEVDGPAKK